MKLISLKASNYRIHSATSLAFDPALTLVGGPNESGKSTLVEAAFNALFMRSKKTGDDLDKMKSLSGGHPEVELSFEQGGETYTLKKFFRGTTGRSFLESLDGRVYLEGDQAEQKVFELLGLDSPSNSRSTPQQWAHLWVRQGQSSRSPSDTAAERQHLLFDLLQQGMNPAAAIVQSPEDSRLGFKFDEMVKDQFNRDGSPKANTDLGRMRETHSEASLARQSAENKCVELEEAAENLEAVEAEYKDAIRILEESREDLEKVEELLRQVESLRSTLTLQTANRDTLTGRFQALEQADQQIGDKERELAEEVAAAAPLTQAVTDAAAEEQRARTAHENHDQTHEGLMAGRLAAEITRDLYSKCVDHLRLEEEITRLRGQVDDVGAIRNEMTSKAQELGVCPTVTSKDITKLQTLETACTEAKAALDAIATRMEIVRSSQTVVIDGRELSAGESVTFSEGTDLCIGDMVTIRITPGGGLNLHEARQALRNSETAFAERLRSLGVPGTSEARDAKDRRLFLEREIAGLQERLDNLGEPRGDLAAKEGELQVLETTILQHAQQTRGFIRPANLQTATLSLRTSEANYALAKQHETTSSARHRLLAVELQNATSALTRANGNVSASRQRQDGLSAQITLLVDTHGNLCARTEQLAALRTQVDGAKMACEATKTQLDDLQPDLLNDRKSRLESARRNESLRRDSAFQRMADARAKLAHEGDMDPRQTRAVAVARESAALRRLQEKQRRGDAVKLLARLFAEEQESLNARLAGPLEQKVGVYLQCIFGPGAGASISLQGRNFSGFNFRREGVGTFDFSSLSGGTKEQVAVAFRLAMAEVLAADHGGSLPVILDDAFTNSDEDRIRKLRDMLYRATRNGLQVIVFSCNPRDYQSLGGRTETLSSRTSNHRVPVLPALMVNPAENLRGTRDDVLEVEMDDPIEREPVVNVEAEDEEADGGVIAPPDHKDEFLSALRSMEGHSSRNTVLRKHLCWSKDLYEEVKNALLAEGTIRSGGAREESVSLIL